MKNMKRIIKDLTLGSVLGLFIYVLSILQSYYIYFDSVPAIMNILTPILALFLELLFITYKNNNKLRGFIRVLTMFIIAFLLLNCNNKIYTFVVNNFDIYESSMIDNTSGLCVVLYMFFVFVGVIISAIIIWKKSKNTPNTADTSLSSDEKQK